LYVTGDSLGGRLNTMHNLHHYQSLMTQIRERITDGTFGELLTWARQRDERGRGPSWWRVDEEQ
jgi:queuine tRNA-ribosyltransferase